MKAEFQVRRMREEDAAAVAAIEAASFSTPWTLEDFCADLSFLEYRFLVAEREGEILGYAGVRIVLDEAEVTTIAVREDARRGGIGRALLRDLKELCRGEGVASVYLEVRESNGAARRLYESEGFRVSGRRKNYYRAPQEDALLLAVQLSDSSFH